MTGLIRNLALGILLLAAGGCTTLIGGDSTPTTLYGLKAPADIAIAGGEPGWQLMVEEPLAERALDTDRIAIHTDTHAIQYFAGARWTDRAPRMLQDLIVESFDAAGMQNSVGRQTLAVRPDYALVSDLREFSAHLVPGESGPQAHVRLSVKIVSLDDRSVIDGRTFDARASATSDNVADVVKALDAASNDVLRELVAWTAELGRSQAGS